jgi:hypothetical protein
MATYPRVGLFGLVAEFDSPKSLIAAIKKVRAGGYRKIEAYTPYPMEDVFEALELPPSKLPLIVLLGGIIGAVAGFGLQWWSSVIAYPLHVAGRPLNSWIAFIPVTFETTVLIAAGSAVLGMFILNGLPMPYHPLFKVQRFKLASRDRYFLAIDAEDPQFDREQTAELLRGLDPIEVSEVEH